MTHDELAAQCRKQIELAGDSATVTLVLPGRWGTRATKRLWRGGPVGQIVSETMRRGRVVSWCSSRRVRFLQRSELPYERV